jgi:hypothetical protein
LNTAATVARRLTQLLPTGNTAGNIRMLEGSWATRPREVTGTLHSVLQLRPQQFHVTGDTVSRTRKSAPTDAPARQRHANAPTQLSSRGNLDSTDLARRLWHGIDNSLATVRVAQQHDDNHVLDRSAAEQQVNIAVPRIDCTVFTSRERKAVPTAEARQPTAAPTALAAPPPPRGDAANAEPLLEAAVISVADLLAGNIRDLAARAAPVALPPPSCRRAPYVAPRAHQWCDDDVRSASLPAPLASPKRRRVAMRAATSPPFVPHAAVDTCTAAAVIMREEQQPAALVTPAALVAQLPTDGTFVDFALFERRAKWDEHGGGGALLELVMNHPELFDVSQRAGGGRLKLRRTDDGGGVAAAAAAAAQRHRATVGAAALALLLVDGPMEMSQLAQRVGWLPAHGKFGSFIKLSDTMFDMESFEGGWLVRAITPAADR